MSRSDTHGTDAGKALLFSQLAEQLQEAGRAKFVADSPAAFLMFHGADLSGADPGETKVPVGRANTAATTFHVFPLVKRTENGETAITLGRTPDNDLVVMDDTISRRHAAFEQQNGAWRMFDMGSSNGTFVGDDAVPTRDAGPIPLAPRANLRFGSVQMKFMPIEDFIQFAEAFIGPVA